MTGPVGALVSWSARASAYLVVALLAFFATAGVALACVGAAEPTTLTTSLSGESKSGAEITVLEGAKVKDQATLEGKNAAKATGKISYAVYLDSSCKELVTKAGEFEFTGGSVPASEEKTLEAGKTYYWQAHYGGDSLDAESTSTCGSEVLKVKAATSISTQLHGYLEGKEVSQGTEITLPEGLATADSATLAGTNASTATGSIVFKAYEDGECKELASSPGGGSLSGGTAISEAVTLGEGTYYWQVSYAGDSLHQASTSTCGEILKILTPTLEVVRASTKNGGQNAPSCVFKAAAEICEIEIKNIGTEALTVTNPQFAGPDLGKFQEILGKVGGLPECNNGAPIPIKGSCGKKIETKPKVFGPGKGNRFWADWIFEGENAANKIKAVALTVLEWTE